MMCRATYCLRGEWWTMIGKLRPWNGMPLLDRSGAQILRTIHASSLLNRIHSFMYHSPHPCRTFSYALTMEATGSSKAWAHTVVSHPRGQPISTDTTTITSDVTIKKIFYITSQFLICMNNLQQRQILSI
jgi:hypothetical protein